MNTPFKKIWGMPALFGAVILFGLLSALLGTGFWYWLSWMALLAPVIIIIQKIMRSKVRAH